MNAKFLNANQRHYVLLKFRSNCLLGKLSVVCLVIKLANSCLQFPVYAFNTPFSSNNTTSIMKWRLLERFIYCPTGDYNIRSKFVNRTHLKCLLDRNLLPSMGIQLEISAKVKVNERHYFQSKRFHLYDFKIATLSMKSRHSVATYIIIIRISRWCPLSDFFKECLFP